VDGQGGFEGVNELGAARLGRAGVLGDVGVVVRGGTGHDQVQEVHFGDVERVAVLALDGKCHAGTLAGFGVVHGGDGEHDAGQLRGAGGHGVRAADGSVELGAGRFVALGALVIVHLGQVDVIQAAGEV